MFSIPEGGVRRGGSIIELVSVVQVLDHAMESEAVCQERIACGMSLLPCPAHLSLVTDSFVMRCHSHQIVVTKASCATSHTQRRHLGCRVRKSHVHGTHNLAPSLVVLWGFYFVDSFLLHKLCDLQAQGEYVVQPEALVIRPNHLTTTVILCT